LPLFYSCTDIGKNLPNFYDYFSCQWHKKRISNAAIDEKRKMGSLKDKVVFITGGSIGIGRATALTCLDDGARVFIMSRSEERVRRLVSETKSESVSGYAGDVADETAVRTAFDLCIRTFGTVDVLLNNAGIGIPTPDLAETALSSFEQMVATNMKGVFLCTRQALKIMKPRGSGHILTVISMAGQRTNPGSPLYCASKFGARGLSGGLADQVLKHGIKVTDINPGPVDSDYWGTREVPKDKFLKVEDVAHVIRFVLTTAEHVLIREINFDNIRWLTG
jgi:NADP-dependent 3-hydroxy acid dehydrogenase YdfG